VGEVSETLGRGARFLMLANGWRFALSLLAIALALLIFGELLARFIGVALLVGSLAMAWKLGGSRLVRRQ